MLDLQVTGGDKVAKMLDKLGKAEQGEFKKAAKKETREGLRAILAAAKAAAPVQTGRLRKAIKLRAWRRPGRGEVGNKVFIDPGRKRDDPRGAYYGSMIESGRVVGGRYIAGRYMLTNAYKQGGDAAQRKLSAGISAVADRIITGG
jgi:hypothetical protein